MSDRRHDAYGSRSPSQLAAYQDLFDRIQDCVMILDEGTHVILDINPSGLQLFGQAKEKLVGRTVMQWLDASSREDFIHASRVSSRRPEWHRFDTLWRMGEDRSVTLEINASLINLPDHRVMLQIIARDVTARRQAEQVIQGLQQQLSIFQAAAVLPIQSGPMPELTPVTKISRSG